MFMLLLMDVFAGTRSFVHQHNARYGVALQSYIELFCAYSQFRPVRTRMAMQTEATLLFYSISGYPTLHKVY